MAREIRKHDPYTTHEAIIRVRRHSLHETTLGALSVIFLVAMMRAIREDIHWLWLAAPVVVLLADAVFLGVTWHMSHVRSRRYRRAFVLHKARRTIRWRRLAIRHHRRLLWSAPVVILAAHGVGIWAAPYAGAWAVRAAGLLQTLSIGLGIGALCWAGYALLTGVRTGWTPHCDRCEHDLTGVPDLLRCPECGEVLTASTIRRGELMRKRGPGALLLAIGIAFFTPLRGAVMNVIEPAIVQAMPTRALLYETTGDSVLLLLRFGTAEQELFDRVDASPTTRAEVMDFYIKSLESVGSTNRLYSLSEWAMNQLADGAMRPEDIDRLALAVWRGLQGGNEEAERLWDSVQRTAPEAAARARRAHPFSDGGRQSGGADTGR